MTTLSQLTRRIVILAIAIKFVSPCPNSVSALNNKHHYSIEQQAPLLPSSSYFANTNFLPHRQVNDLEKTCPMKHIYLTHWYKDHYDTITPLFALPTILFYLKSKIQQADHYIFDKAANTNTNLFNMLKEFDYKSLVRLNYDISNIIEQEVPRHFQKDKKFVEIFQKGLILAAIEHQQKKNIAMSAIRVISRIPYLLDYTPTLTLFSSKNIGDQSNSSARV